jgi:hypothetical protein
MSRTSNTTVLAAILTLAAASPTWPHHSHGNYVEAEWTYLDGTVTEVHWMNPHSWIYLEVMEADGRLRVWALEGTSVAQLRVTEWTPDNVVVGDKVSVSCHPLRDGSRGCLLGVLTKENGVEVPFE